MAWCGIVTMMNVYVLFCCLTQNEPDKYFPSKLCLDPTGALNSELSAPLLDKTLLKWWVNASTDSKCRHPTFISRANRCSTFLVTLVLSGDIATNPGPPNYKYPCGMQNCGKPVKKNQKGILCEDCNIWFHTKCVEISDEVHRELCENSDHLSHRGA